MTSSATNQDGYRFLIHGSPEYRLFQNRAWAARGLPRRRHVPREFTFESIINHESLLEEFRHRRGQTKRAGGIDGFVYQDFRETEFARVAKVTVKAIREGRWHPRQARTKFVPKGNGRFRRLDIRCVVDRVVSGVLATEAIQHLDGLFGDHVFGFRPSRCTSQLLARLAYRVENAGKVVIAQDDIRDAFPSLNIEHAVDDFSRHVRDPELLDLIEKILRGHRQTERITGVEQGDALSPLALNLRLHHCLDAPASPAAATDSTSSYRYADNLLYQCETVPEADQVLQRDQNLLNEAGFSLREDFRSSINLQRCGAKVKLLGFSLSQETDGRVRFDINSKAFIRLGNMLEQVHELADPSNHAKSALYGWIEPYGPAFEADRVRGYLDRIQQAIARAGFYEISNRNQITEMIERARSRWTTLRSREVEKLNRASHLS